MIPMGRPIALPARPLSSGGFLVADAEAIRLQEQAAKKLAHAIVNTVACGLAALKCGPSIAHAAVEELELALIGYLCCGYDEQIKAIEAAQERMRQAPQEFQPWKPTVEGLAELVDRRDKLAQMIADAETAMGATFGKMGSEANDAGAAMMRIAINPIKEQLEGLEKQISEWQRMMEAE